MLKYLIHIFACVIFQQSKKLKHRKYMLEITKLGHE